MSLLIWIGLVLFIVFIAGGFLLALLIAFMHINDILVDDEEEKYHD